MPQTIGQLTMVAGREDESALARLHDFGQRAGPGDDDGNPVGQGLDGHIPEWLLPNRRNHDDIDLRIECLSLGPAEKRCHGLREPRAHFLEEIRIAVPGDDVLERGVLAEFGCRVGQRHDALDRRDHPDEADADRSRIRHGALRHMRRLFHCARNDTTCRVAEIAVLLVLGERVRRLGRNRIDGLTAELLSHRC